MNLTLSVLSKFIFVVVKKFKLYNQIDKNFILNELNKNK